MNEYKNIPAFLESQDIEYRIDGGGNQIYINCPFCSHDKKKLTIEAVTGLFYCFVCGESGGDFKFLAEKFTNKSFEIDFQKIKKNEKIDPPALNKSIVKENHKRLIDHHEPIRDWLHNRGLNDDTIKKFKLGWDGKSITIPIYDANGDCHNFRLKRDPTLPSGSKGMISVPGRGRKRLFNEVVLKDKIESIIICEGEWDCMLLDQLGYNAVTSTVGVQSFDKSWVEYFKDIPKIYICYDQDRNNAGHKGALKTADFFHRIGLETHIVTLPHPRELPHFVENVDVTDFIVKLGKTKTDFGILLAKSKQYNPSSSGEDEEYSGIEVGVYYPPTIKPSEIPRQIEKDDVLDVLERTIKKDNVNKLAVFLAELLAYTEDSQFNISFNAPSSSGKSYIPIEIATLFPHEDIIDLSYASPTSFFHSQSKFDSKRKVGIVDLQRKILIFLDMPHPDLLTRLRSLLSHDKKVIKIKITDKTSKSGTRAKDIEILGFPTVIFCSASFNFDEQELTRLLLLSPETSQEKLREAINQKAKYLTNPAEYAIELSNDIKRNELKERIYFIKHANIQYINLHDETKLLQKFNQRYKNLKPRHTRDIVRIASITKAFSLLNLWHRDYNEETGTITTNDSDYENAFVLWDEISQAQDLGLSPYLLNFYNEIILKAYQEKGSSITKQELLKKHFEVNGRHLQDWSLRKDILPTLETSGIIAQEKDPLDKRKILITPVLFSTPSDNIDRLPIESDSTHPLANSTISSNESKSKECGVCGGTNFWKRKDGVLICSKCHPRVGK